MGLVSQSDQQIMVDTLNGLDLLIFWPAFINSLKRFSVLRTACRNETVFNPLCVPLQAQESGLQCRCLELSLPLHCNYRGTTVIHRLIVDKSQRHTGDNESACLLVPSSDGAMARKKRTKCRRTLNLNYTSTLIYNI